MMSFTECPVTEITYPFMAQASTSLVCRSGYLGVGSPALHTQGYSDQNTSFVSGQFQGPVVVTSKMQLSSCGYTDGNDDWSPYEI